MLFRVGRGVQIKDILPSYDETLEKFDKLGLTIKPIPAYCVEVPLGFRRMRLFGRYFCKHPCQLIRMKFRAKRLKWLNRTYVPFSPFVFGYSDICLVSSKHIRQFVYYCGVFAACNLFVEIALPTALTMCVEPGELVTEENISLRGKYDVVPRRGETACRTIRNAAREVVVRLARGYVVYPSCQTVTMEMMVVRVR